MTTKNTYKRGQVEWALWHLFAYPPLETQAPSKIFLTRIKRLLELDRNPEIQPGSGILIGRHAFFDESPEGHGIDMAYTSFNSFCLALGLDLLDAGFKQSEIVYFLRHIRGELETNFRKILKSPHPKELERIEGEPQNTPYYEMHEANWVDRRIFIVVEKIEFKEAFPGRNQGNIKKLPIIFKPKFCRGLSGLYREMSKMNRVYRKALVIEIALTAKRLVELLETAPLVKRGRK